MLKRILTALAAVAGMLPFLWFSDTFMMVIFAGVLSFVAVYEMLGCIGVRKKLLLSVPSLIFSVLIPVKTRYFTADDRFFTDLFFIFFAYCFYLLAVSVFARKTTSVVENGLCAVLTLYITFGLSSLVLLRDAPYGKYLYFMAFLIPWCSDIFAYFFGIAFGRHKLIPEISPKKTVEGAVAGVVFGTLSLVVFGMIVSPLISMKPSYLVLILVGAVVSVMSQVGDLVASAVKRHFGVKDYGFILPGHGGIMDRFDSVIATAPFLYISCSLSSMINFFS